MRSLRSRQKDSSAPLGASDSSRKRPPHAMRFVVFWLTVVALTGLPARGSAQSTPGETPPPATPNAPTVDTSSGPDGTPTGEPEPDESPRPVLEEDPSKVALPSIPNADIDQALGLPLRSIEITGLRRIAPEDVSSYLKEKIGEPFDPSALRLDVKTLWRQGYFEDVEVDLKSDRNGVRLRFHVKERATVVALEFEDNNEINDEDLAEGIEVKKDAVLSFPALNRSIQKIRDMYAEKGFFLAEAKFEVTRQKNNEVTVRFFVKENSQVSVKRVTFIGNEAISTEELKAVMFIGNPGFFAFGSGGPFRQDAFERDVAILSSLYYDKGFLQVAISTPRVMLTPDKSGIEISITIEEGPRFKIRQLRVYEQGPSGEEVEPIGGRRNLRMMLRGKTGQYFNRAELLEDLGLVKALYKDEGYANVVAEPQMNVDATTSEVDVVIPIVRGPLVYFERIEVRGNTKTRDRVIRRELEIYEGRKYSESKLDRSRRRVTALGYFERVDFSTEQGSSPDRLVLYVDVAEKPTGTFQIGAGLSSIENFIGTAQVQQSNLFGNGQTLALQAQISGLRTLINLQFVEPYFLDSQFSLSANAFDRQTYYQDFSQRSRGGAFTISYPLINPEVALGLTYSGSYDEALTSGGGGFNFLGTSPVRNGVFSQLPLANLFQNGFTSSLKPGITYDSRDNRLTPTSGLYLNLSTEFASPAFASENEFTRTTWTGRFYAPIWKGLVFKVNTNAGLVTSHRASGVPIFARFFLGGIFDLRGFVYRTVGPRMPLNETTDPNSSPRTNGALIGGNLMYYQNVELEFPIFEPVGLKAVAFTDLGNAWNLEGNYCQAAGGAFEYRAISPCFSADSLLDMRTSWGFGLRWFSPMGPLRFEWAFPFAPLPFEDKTRFEFTIGNFF